MPHPFNVVKATKITRRCRAVAVVNTTFSAQDFMQLAGMCAVSAILGIPDNWGFKLKSIKIWSPVATAGTTVFNSIMDVSIDSTENDTNGVPTMIMDSSMSFDKPAFVHYKPKKNSPNSFYKNGQAGAIAVAMIQIQCPIGSIIDVEMNIISAFNRPSNSYTQVIAGAGIGAHYVHPLGGGGLTTCDGLTVL